MRIADQLLAHIQTTERRAVSEKVFSYPVIMQIRKSGSYWTDSQALREDPVGIEDEMAPSLSFLHLGDAASHSETTKSLTSAVPGGAEHSAWFSDCNTDGCRQSQ